MRIQALRTEVLTGPFTTVTDRAGGTRLAEGLNACTLGGNLITQPELRYTPSGDAVTDSDLALNETSKDRSGATQKRTSFMRVTAWKHLAELVCTLPKGTPITVVGEAVSDAWLTDDGQKRSIPQFEASSLYQVFPPTASVVPAGSAEVMPEPVNDTELSAGLEDFPHELDMPF